MPEEHGDSADARTISRPTMRQQLDQHGIEIQSAPASPLFEATPESHFSSRKVRYTVAIGLRRITRETTYDRLSTELMEFIGQKKATLVGLDGINGFRCGLTEDELRGFAHPLEEEE